MISAKAAKEQTEIGKVTAELQSIDKLIKSAFKQGRSHITKTGKLTNEALEKLEELGYNVEPNAIGQKISW